MRIPISFFTRLVFADARVAFHARVAQLGVCSSSLCCLICIAPHSRRHLTRHKTHARTHRLTLLFACFSRIAGSLSAGRTIQTTCTTVAESTEKKIQVPLADRVLGVERDAKKRLHVPVTTRTHWPFVVILLHASHDARTRKNAPHRVRYVSSELCVRM